MSIEPENLIPDLGFDLSFGQGRFFRLFQFCLKIRSGVLDVLGLAVQADRFFVAEGLGQRLV